MKKYIAILIPLYVMFSLSIINCFMVVSQQIGNGEIWRMAIAFISVIIFAIITSIFTKKVKEQ